MGTYNAQAFTKDSWLAFKQFSQAFSQKFAATAWGACVEETLHPTLAQPSIKFHMGNYFYWGGGDGVRLANTDALVFQ